MPGTITRETNRFSGKCDDCVRPIVVENAEQRGDHLRSACPECAQVITLERLYGTFTDHNCNALCQYAYGPICECACGGANHQAGYLPLVPGGEIPASALARYRRSVQTRRDAVEKRRATRARNAALRLAEMVQAWFDNEDAPVREVFDIDTDLEGTFGMSGWDLSTVTDIRRKLHENGTITDRARDYAMDLVRRSQERAARAQAIAAERANEENVPAPEGRVTFSGVVIKRTERETDFGMVWKLVIKVKTADGKVWLVWVSEPSAITTRRGDVVQMTATLKRSDRDACFAFGKRPSNTSIVRHEELGEADALADPEQLAAF